MRLPEQRQVSDFLKARDSVPSQSEAAAVQVQECQLGSIAEVLMHLVEERFLSADTILLADWDNTIRIQDKLKAAIMARFNQLQPAEYQLLSELVAARAQLEFIFAIITNQVTHGWLRNVMGPGHGHQVARVSAALTGRADRTFPRVLNQLEIPYFGGSTHHLLPVFLKPYKSTALAVQEVGDWLATQNSTSQHRLIMVGDWDSDMMFGKRLWLYLQQEYGFSGELLLFRVPHSQRLQPAVYNDATVTVRRLAQSNS